MKPRSIIKRVLGIIFMLLSVIHTYAHKNDSTDRKVKSMISLDFRPGYILPTHDFFRGYNRAGKGFGPHISGHLKYGFKFSPNTELGRLYPHAIQGIGIAYNTFSNSYELGNPIAVYVFQTSRIAKITDKLSFDYEWNFGASFGWKKYDDITNQWNRVVGSKINAYINLGFLINWEVFKNTNIRAGVGINHYSNGNTSYPNAGVNSVQASIALTRFFGNNDYDRPEERIHNNINDKEKFKGHISYDLIVYGATKKKGIFPPGSNPVLAPGSYAVIGLNFNPLYNFNRYFRAGFSLDFQYDESANIVNHIANESIPSDPDELKFYRPGFKEQFSTGLSIRAEIVMPIFSINIGLGKNFICKGSDTNSFYQNFVLKTNITKNFFIHTGYQLYRFKDPNNLMLGIGYRFNAR